MNQSKRAGLKQMCRNIRAALAQADSRDGVRRSVPALREALRPGARRASPVLRAAATPASAEQLRAARQRLAMAKAEKIGQDRPSTMKEYRDGLQRSRDERLRRLAALQLEMVEPISGQRGRRNPFVRSNQDNHDGGMPFDLAHHAGRM